MLALVLASESSRCPQDKRQGGRLNSINPDDVALAEDPLTGPSRSQSHDSSAAQVCDRAGTLPRSRSHSVVFFVLRLCATLWTRTTRTWRTPATKKPRRRRSSPSTELCVLGDVVPQQQLRFRIRVVSAQHAHHTMTTTRSLASASKPRNQAPHCPMPTPLRAEHPISGQPPPVA